MKNHFSSRWTSVILVSLCAAAAFGSYYNALLNGYIWDDPIVLQWQIPAFLSARDIFLPPDGIPEFSGHYYRPLVVLSFIIDRIVWHNSPFGYHFTVVLFHLLNTIIVFYLSRIILRGSQYAQLGAFLSSLVFAVHPIHTESVDWIAGRSDVMAALFFFLSLLFYFQWKMKEPSGEKGFRSYFFLLMPPFLFFVACLAKETSLSLILLLPVIDFLFTPERMPSLEAGSSAKNAQEQKGKKGKKGTQKHDESEDKRGSLKERRRWHGAFQFRSYLFFLGSAVIYYLLRRAAMGGEQDKVRRAADLSGMLGNTINTFGFYIQKLFFPFNLNAYISEIPSGYRATLLNLVLVVLLLAAVLLSVWRKKRIITFCISFFFITLIPSVAVALFHIAEIPLAERYLYIPSLSLGLILGHAFVSLPDLIGKEKRLTAGVRAAILLIVISLAVCFSILTIGRNHVYKDDLSFWEDVVAKGAQHAVPHLNLAQAYQEKNRLNEAEKEYQKALEARSRDEIRSLVYNSLGSLRLKKNDFDGAEACFDTSISLRRNFALPYHNMALTIWKRHLGNGKTDPAQRKQLLERAIGYLDQAIRINPQFADAHDLYAKILIRQKRNDEARKHLEAVVRYTTNEEKARKAREMLDKLQNPAGAQ